jgi:hypothetical protein
MLFKAKNEENPSRFSPNENPRPPRYTSVAHLGINEFEGEAVLRNISTGGFRMESKTYAAITVGEQYVIQIKPEAASGLRPFDLEVEVRWIKSTETSFSAGFRVIKSPSDRSYEKYIAYISHK